MIGAENVDDAQFPNVGTSDYAPYLTAMDAEKADGTLAAMWGSDAPRVVGQYAEYGLNKKMPPDIAGWDLTPEQRASIKSWIEQDATDETGTKTLDNGEGQKILESAK